MATANLQVRIDAALKQEAEKTLKSMGLSMSTAIHLFVVRSLIRDVFPLK